MTPTTTFDKWLDLFGLRGTVQPRATGLIFDWCVTSASYDLAPTVIVAQFGDGYAQRRPAGINTQNRDWSLAMQSVLPNDAEAILAFLEARNGVDVFNWTPPGSTSAQNVICPSWSFSYADIAAGGVRLGTITMKFQQVHV